MRTVGGFVVALSLARATLAAQSGAFIVRLGTDTLFVEQYMRRGTDLQGDQVARATGATFLRHFTATLDRRGNVVRYALTARPAAHPDAPARTLQVRFEADTANIEFEAGDTSRSQRLWMPGGALPLVPRSYAMLELVTRQAQASHRQSFVAPVLSLTTLAPIAATITRGAGDTLTLVIGDAAPVRLLVDSAGLILGASGVGTTEQVHVDRVRAVDIATIAHEFADRPLGQLSPPDSVRATIAGARIAIDYSRPAMRGRKIFGDLVPWNQVWRTGANAATRFTTSADLLMGGKTVPSGSYTLWTLPTPTGWKLIINKRTTAPCQGDACTRAARPPLWGTDYAPDSDLVRVDLELERLEHPLERFTITLEPHGRGGVFALAWETTRASLPFTRK
ncbi:MAG TPA: DUF2911 domain-containing protein [Gemmatimonadales bacterium]|nr:DUF2911 domain-containing protein [Gemmatimonadales bacterium]